jgi:hypothetical protein
MTGFVQGSLHTPYFIFARCAGRYGDDQLLNRFDLGDYLPVTSIPPYGRYAILADDGRWVMIADDWFYTLWHKKTTRPAIEELASQCDVFACSVGDCDHSFDFVYYRNGRLVRKHVVADPDFRGGKVVENIGEPLAGEAAAFEKKDDELNIVLTIAGSLGIKTNYSEGEVRLYATSAQKTL